MYNTKTLGKIGRLSSPGTQNRIYRNTYTMATAVIHRLLRNWWQTKGPHIHPPKHTHTSSHLFANFFCALYINLNSCFLQTFTLVVCIWFFLFYYGYWQTISPNTSKYWLKKRLQTLNVKIGNDSVRHYLNLNYTKIIDFHFISVY